MSKRSNQLIFIIVDRELRAWCVEGASINSLTIHGEESFEINHEKNILSAYRDLVDFMAGDSTHIERVHVISDKETYAYPFKHLVEESWPDSEFQQLSWEQLTKQLALKKVDEAVLRNAVFPWLLNQSGDNQVLGDMTLTAETHQTVAADVEDGRITLVLKAEQTTSDGSGVTKQHKPQVSDKHQLKSRYLQFLQHLREQLQAVDAEQVSLFQDIDWLAEQISNFKPVIAVTGKFSAGKSRLLNCYIGGRCLPEDQSPKTAFATELHYAESESQQRLELIYDNDIVKTVAISEIEAAEHDANIRYARLCIHSPRLQAMPDLVLVDMPGFDSGLQAHQKAISYYLAKADFFINLLPVEIAFDHSINRHLEEVYYDHEKDFACILTKAARKTPKELADIKTVWISNLSPVFPHINSIGHIETAGHNYTIEAFENIIHDCLQHSDEFLRNRWQDAVVNVLHSVQGNIQGALNLASANDAELRESLQQAEQQFNRLQNQLTEELESFSYRLSSVGKEQLISEARSALNSAAGSLAQAAKSNTLNEALADILRPLLQVRAQQLVEQEMQRLQLQLNQLQNLPSGLFSINLQIPEQEKTHFSLLFAGVGAGVAAMFLGPIGIALAGLLSGLLGRKDNQEEHERQINQKIHNEVIPQALSQVTVQIDNCLQQASQQMSAAMQQRLQQEQAHYQQKRQQIEAELQGKQQDKQQYQLRCQQGLKAIEQEVQLIGLEAKSEALIEHRSEATR